MAPKVTQNRSKYMTGIIFLSNLGTILATKRGCRNALRSVTLFFKKIKHLTCPNIVTYSDLALKMVPI